MLFQGNQIRIARNNQLSLNTFCQRQQIQVLRVTYRYLGIMINFCNTTKRIKDTEKILYLVIINTRANFWSRNDIADFVQQFIADKNVESYIRKDTLHPFSLMADEKRNPNITVENDFHLPYLSAITSSKISSSLSVGEFARLLTNLSSNCSRVSACHPKRRINSFRNPQSAIGTSK